jgi:hypothetical protein
MITITKPAAASRIDEQTDRHDEREREAPGDGRRIGMRRRQVERAQS